MENVFRHTVDFDQIKEIAHKGINRSAAFLGLGVNVSRDPDFKKYQLSEVTLFRIIHDDLDDKSVAHIKEEFEKWVIVNGLRELVESFAIFLDRIHSACLLMAVSKDKLKKEDGRKYETAFEKKGVAGKLRQLKSRFGIETKQEKYHESINKARNCISHRNGRVGYEDAGNDNIFRLIWWTMDVYVETPKGEKIPLNAPFSDEGIYLRDGGSIMMKFTDRTIEYNVGQFLRLTPHELSEICFMFKISTDEIIKSSVEYANKIGIEFKEKEKCIQQSRGKNS